MFVFVNPNSCGVVTGDCVVRSLSLATGHGWREVYASLCVQGYAMCDWGNSNPVWGSWLTDRGWTMMPAEEMQTVEEFAARYPRGIYIVCTGSHVVTIIDGDWYDSWDSRNAKISYYFLKPDQRRA